MSAAETGTIAGRRWSTRRRGHVPRPGRRPRCPYRAYAGHPAL